MRKINFNFLFPLLALVLLVFVLSTQMFNVPPIGKLLDPFVGAVQNESDPGLSLETFDLAGLGLKDSVHVYFDARKVPHIYAGNEEDLYFTQGYVTAYLRLWQMDFLSYVAGGRLSEVFKEGFLDHDRNQRRIGMLHSAKAALALIEKDPVTRNVLDAYTRGVNAYIRRLDYRTMPFEYKLLDYQPEPWSNLKSVLLMKHMANTLSGFEEDYNTTNLMLALGEERFNLLFPSFASRIVPVVNDSVSKENAALAYVKKPDYLDYSFVAANAVVPKSPYNPRLGSNSWVVSGKKTKSGAPILASDPHLNLVLPAIWVEVQLTAPGVNVYGASIPGTPAVIIGFNENVAWGLTNGQDDVKDWFKLKVTEDYKKYELDGEWLDLKFTVEEIRRKGQKEFYDTVYHSVHGPVVHSKSFPGANPGLVNHALRWELHNASNEFLSFLKLSKARDYGDFKEAIRHYKSPVQNFTFASKTNDIAVSHQGNLAVKWPGQGKFILDGTKRAHLPTRYIPDDSLPHVLNPSANYVLSANQHPTLKNYQYYYSGNFSETRAHRIKELLESESGFTMDKMKKMQLDNVNPFALDALPVLAKRVARGKLTAPYAQLLDSLAAWHATYSAEDPYAKLFDGWWRNIRERTWDEFKRYSFGPKLPDDYVLLDLVATDPSNEYFDVQGTSARENAGDLIHEAFVAASREYDTLKRQGATRWGDHNRLYIMHMTNFNPFSVKGLPSGGYPDAINAMAPNWGPSWRMIVELGDRPRAVGIYAGGQSGNVGSPFFDNYIPDWNQGKYYPLSFFISAAEARNSAVNTWTLK